MSETSTIPAGDTGANLLTVWRKLQSNRASVQSATLLFFGVLFLPFAGREAGISRLYFSAFVAAPLALGILIGLGARPARSDFLSMPRLSSFAIWCLPVAALFGASNAVDTQAFGLLIGFLALAVIAANAVVNVVAGSGGEFTSDVFVVPATFIAGIFIMLSSVVAAMGSLILFLDAHYRGKLGLFEAKVIGHPEVFLVALPAICVATVVVSKASRHISPVGLYAAPIALFALVGLSSYAVKVGDGAVLSRYMGTPYLFPGLLILAVWALSLLRGVTRENALALLAVVVGVVLVALALLNKSVGDGGWSFGRINGAVVGFALLSSFGGFILWLKEVHNATLPALVSLAVIALTAVGAALTTSYEGVAAQILGAFVEPVRVSAGTVGTSLISAAAIVAVLAAIYELYLKEDAR